LAWRIHEGYLRSALKAPQPAPKILSKAKKAA
jgi:hypothetical protein